MKLTWIKNWSTRPSQILTKEKAAPLLQIGMVWADTPRETARQSEVVFSIVTDSAAVRSLALGENGVITGLAKGAAYLDMSTIDPDASRAIAAEFAKAGLAMLDAPVSGTTLTVTRGQASLMVAGDQAVFERVRPVLLGIGPKLPTSAPRDSPCSSKSLST